MISFTDAEKDKAEKEAYNIMLPICSTLAESYSKVILFLMTFPPPPPAPRKPKVNAKTSKISKPRAKSPAIGSIEYINKQAVLFANSRESKAPKAPATVPDAMVSLILNAYFGIDKSELERIKEVHLKSMGAENLVGQLLERYIASILEPFGWVWCSSAMVKAADFIKPPSEDQPKWHVLQVKNRDNTENSSSSAIRVNTDIDKWFRTFSKKGGSNWDAFPDEILRKHLSEQAFEAFVKSYLHDLKPKKTKLPLRRITKFADSL